MEFLEQGHLISDLQHGFRQNRSCLSSLLLSTEQWTRALDEDGRVDVIYTDFKKAFDSVPHKRLIYKLSEIGIRGTLLTWITDFLTGRSQTVCIEASRSTPTPVLSGVPQGSVLGPLLYLVYINDCVDDLGCSAIMFADDVKLWRPIRSDADRYALQDSLNRLNSWSGRWLLNFNVDKCVVLRLRTRQTSKEDNSFQYVLDGTDATTVAYSSAAAQNNLVIVGYCRASLAALAGATAGILGLTGFLGVTSNQLKILLVLEIRDGVRCKSNTVTYMPTGTFGGIPDSRSKGMLHVAEMLTVYNPDLDKDS
nr:unnamed protein product [Spirometra erinaceieuropaei]